MSLPKPGTEVTVTTEHKMITIDDVKYHEITGTVLTSPKWLKAGEFAVSNSDHPNGFSVIHISNVVDIHDTDGREFKFTTDASVKVWSVTGSTGNTYSVTREYGVYKCTCPGFSFRQTCKHVKDIMSKD